MLYSLYQNTHYKRFIAVLLLMMALSVVLYFHGVNNRGALAADDGSETPAPAVLPQDATQLFLPLVFRDHNAQLVTRMGYGASMAPPDAYPDVRSLNAGWYVDWSAKANPSRPSGMEYVQMIRVHQRITCGSYVTPDRTACPYVTPHAYDYTPDAATIQAIAQAQPGDIWLIGNEMDRLDWSGGGQDEMLPALYAVAYKELYDLIKGADPTAQVAIGGVIQATPMRMAYLTTVWDEYRNLNGVDMPVDVWNVHNFILAEQCVFQGTTNVCYGAGRVPGSKKDGSYLGDNSTHTNLTIFGEQIRRFRQWMKDRGQQAKPLIISEYGILYKPDPDRPDPYLDTLGDPTVVQTFMLQTFDYFLNTKDCALSAIDECHLVQRWNWFTLDHTDNSTNLHIRLIDPVTRQITPTGEKFREYTLMHYAELSKGY